MASGWNLWVWLQCIGVASRCCCKEVYSSLHAGRLKLGFYIMLQQRGSLKLGYVDYQNINN